MTKTPTRQRLIDAAVRRFYRDGFRSVGIDQILADVGISKTAFYKYFESKEDLMLAALESNSRWLQETLLALIRERGGPTPLGQLHALLDVVEHIVESDDYQGCIFVNVAMEFPLPHEPAHIAAAQNKQAIEDIVYGLVVEAGAFLLHSLSETARGHFWRLMSMAMRNGGRCYLEFRTDQDAARPKAFGEHYRRYLDPELVIREAAGARARALHVEQGVGLSPFEDEDPHLCRMILELQP
jgi:AcrR family transcriptional regulator